MKSTVSLVIADGHLNLPQRFVWVYMGKHTHFITLEGGKTEKQEGEGKNVGISFPLSVLVGLGCEGYYTYIFFNRVSFHHLICTTGPIYLNTCFISYHLNITICKNKLHCLPNDSTALVSIS